MADPSSTAFLASRAALMRRLGRMVGCRTVAEDLLHDTWLRAASSQPALNPFALLHRIAFNLAQDHLRALAVHGGASVDLLDQAASSNPDPEQVACDRERVRNTEAAMAAMPSRRRQVFLAVRLEGMTHSDAASRFGITKAAVEKHVARAMQDLAALSRSG